MNRALEAAGNCPEKSVAVYDMRFVKPLDEEILREVSRCKRIITVEDGALKGGLYGAVSEYFADKESAPVIHGVGIPDAFIHQDTQKAQRALCGLDTESLTRLLKTL